CTDPDLATSVRFVFNDGGRIASSPYRPPITIQGARNVFLETCKRGENDDFLDNSGMTLIILRAYEAFGGHASVRLCIGGHLTLLKAFTTNLLEDDDHDQELNILPGDDRDTEAILQLNFRGFEVKTLKLYVKQAPWRFTGQTESKRESWVNIDRLGIY
ncbi:hypothetical protein H0H93_010904, partial [Arthromyces matolae]